MGRRGVNSTFKWFLPVFATRSEGGEGIRGLCQHLWAFWQWRPGWLGTYWKTGVCSHKWIVIGSRFWIGYKFRVAQKVRTVHAVHYLHSDCYLLDDLSHPFSFLNGLYPLKMLYLSVQYCFEVLYVQHVKYITCDVVKRWRVCTRRILWSWVMVSSCAVAKRWPSSTPT